MVHMRLECVDCKSYVAPETKPQMISRGKVRCNHCSAVKCLNMRLQKATTETELHVIYQTFYKKPKGLREGDFWDREWVVEPFAKRKREILSEGC